MAYILSSQNVRIEQQSASIGARTGATIIDLIIMAGLDFIFTEMHVGEMLQDSDTRFLGFVIFFIPWFYPLICEAFMSGQTFGKKALHIRVVTLEGGGPKLTSLILRWLMLPIDLIGAMGIGEMCVFFTERQQRLGDIIAGTWVVKTQTYETENIDLDDYTFSDDYKVRYPKAKNLKPSQILIIADAVNASDSNEVETAMFDLCKKVEEIVGKKQEDTPTEYLQKVLRDYRYEKINCKNNNNNYAEK